MKKRCSERITGCISRRSKKYWDYSKRTFSQNFSKVVEAAFATHRDPCKECLDFLTYSYWWMVASLTLCTTLSLTFLDSSDVQVPNIQIYRYLRHCGCEIKRHLLLGRKAMTNLDSILKSRDITLPTKVCLVKAMYPVVMFGCESWTIKKTECRRIDAFELWCWRRLLRVPWTARRSNQSILKEISPEYSLEGLMLKLKLQYFGHLMQRTDSLEKTLMLGKIEGWRRRGRQRMRWLDGITNSMDMSFE